MRILNLMMFVLIMMTSGCSTRPVLVNESPEIPSNLLERCPDSLPPFKQGDRNTVRRVILEQHRIYHDCRERHNLLVEVLKDGT